MEFSTRLFLSCILSLTYYTTANTPWRIVTTERQTYFVPCPSVGQGQSGKYKQECKSSGTRDKEDRVYKEEESHCIMQQNSHRFRNLVSPTKTVRVKSKLCECSRKKRNAQGLDPFYPSLMNLSSGFTGTLFLFICATTEAGGLWSKLTDSSSFVTSSTICSTKVSLSM